MEQTYWLGRKRASAANARRAASAEARLVHLDLAGRYSIKAAACAPPERQPPPLQPALATVERADPDHYGKLEAGALWLASQAEAEAERETHLGMAGRYARLGLVARAPGGEADPFQWTASRRF